MEYSALKILEHPLATHKLTLLREKCDSTKARQLIYELGLLLAMEVTRGAKLAEWQAVDFEGRPFTGALMEQWNIVAMPILRSGMVLSEAFATVLPSARMGHIGIHHDYTDSEPAVTYLVSVPSAPDLTDIIIIDSLIGTGETMLTAVDELRDLGIKTEQMCLAVLSVHDQGLAAFYGEDENSSIPVYTFERRSEVDERNLPIFGFGNTADRIYGTGEV